MAAARRAALGGRGACFSAPLCWIQPIIRGSHRVAHPRSTPDPLIPIRPVKNTTLDLLPVHSAPWLLQPPSLRRPDIPSPSTYTTHAHAPRTHSASPHTCLVVMSVDRHPHPCASPRQDNNRRKQAAPIGRQRLAGERSNPKKGLQPLCWWGHGLEKEKTLVAGMIAQASALRPSPPWPAALSTSPRHGK